MVKPLLVIFRQPCLCAALRKPVREDERLVEGPRIRVSELFLSFLVAVVKTMTKPFSLLASGLALGFHIQRRQLQLHDGLLGAGIGLVELSPV